MMVTLRQVFNFFSSSITSTIFFNFLFVLLVFFPAYGSFTYPSESIGRLILRHEHLCTAYIIKSSPHLIHEEFGQTQVYYNIFVSAGHCFPKGDLDFPAFGDLIFETQPYETDLGNNFRFWNEREIHPVWISAFGNPMFGGKDILVGAFSTRFQMRTLEPDFDYMPKKGDKVIIIGFGGKVLRNKISEVSGKDEDGHILIKDPVIGGFSGSPVILLSTGKVIATEVSSTIASGHTGLECTLVGCPITGPSYAVPISQIKELVDKL
jgi:hypothetical protein